MRRGKMIILIFVALSLSVFAAFVANNILSATARSQVVEVEVKDVVVAKLQIPYGEKIDAATLTTKSMPVKLVSDNSFASVDEVAGNVALSDIYPGEVIIKDRISDKPAGTTLASLISKSKRAVAVRVNDVIGVAGFLLPGNNVDVLSSVLIKRRAITKTILQNVKVLAVDQTTSANEDDPVVVRAVTLELTSKQSEIIFKAMQEGSIQLTLRNPNDESIHVVESQPEQVEAKPVKKKLTAKTAVRVVTIIRGTSQVREKL